MYLTLCAYRQCQTKATRRPGPGSEPPERMRKRRERQYKLLSDSKFGRRPAIELHGVNILSFIKKKPLFLNVPQNYQTNRKSSQVYSIVYIIIYVDRYILYICGSSYRKIKKIGTLKRSLELLLKSIDMEECEFHFFAQFLKL